MNENKKEINLSFIIPTQTAILILHYGGIVQGLPLWVIWFPISIRFITAIIIGITFGIIESVKGKNK